MQGNFNKIINKIISLDTWKTICIALILGIITGLSLGPKASYLKPFGDLFLNALHMVIIPVIFSAIITAILSLKNTQQMHKITIKAFCFYLGCLIIASGISILISLLLTPGANLILTDLSQHHSTTILANPVQYNSIYNFWTNILPANPLAAVVNENILQIVIFAILLGVAIKKSGDRGKIVGDFFIAFSHIIQKLTMAIMRFAPIGVFALIAYSFGIFGLKALTPLFMFMMTLIISSLVLISFYCLILLIIFKVSPIKFLKNILPAILFAFSTTSSAVTLPVSIECAEKNLNIPANIAKFLLPLGCNFNLAGLSMYLTIAAIFTANIYGIHLGLENYLAIVISVILTTMGAGAIPGSAIIVMGAVLSSMSLPLGAIPLIAGIDRINDMIQTSTNVVSDLFATYVVSKPIPQDINKNIVLEQEL